MFEIRGYEVASETISEPKQCFSEAGQQSFTCMNIYPFCPFRLSLAGQTLTRGESGQIPIIIWCLTRQEFLGVLIDLVANRARGCLFWHGTWRAWHFNRSPAFSEHVPIMFFIRYPAAEYATPKPNRNLTRLSPPHVRVWPARLVPAFRSFANLTNHTLRRLFARESSFLHFSSFQNEEKRKKQQGNGLSYTNSL